MSETTRRNFMIRAGAGAAVAGAAVIAAPARAGSSSPAAASVSHEPLMVYVSDPSKGEVTVMAGERETVVIDHDLVARLARAAG